VQIFFESVYINGTFGNACTIYKMLEKYIKYVVNAYIDA